MLNEIIPYVLPIKSRFPGHYYRIVAFARRFFTARLGIYPRRLGDEEKAVRAVLRSSQWNMTAGKGLAHEKLEAAFAEFVGVPYAIAVNTGGMALQMSMRALGLKPCDEVIHQVDTCSATALAVIAAGCAPVFSDISERTLMLDARSVEQCISPRSRALIATHMWGNPEDMIEMLALADKHKLQVIEDACLALGASLNGRMAGSFGRVGVFSFGAIKPIQSGEGGMIVTSDEALARELRAMRHWGDQTLEYGVRDTLRPAWNGRISEILAAVVHEQLKGYPKHLAGLQETVAEFGNFISNFDGLELVLGNGKSTAACAFTQVVLRLEPRVFGRSKRELKEALYERGVSVWHANFEPITTLSLFRQSLWEEWLPTADKTSLRSNYLSEFPVAQRLHERTGLGLGKMNFLSSQNLRHLNKQIELLSRRIRR